MKSVIAWRFGCLASVVFYAAVLPAGWAQTNARGPAAAAPQAAAPTTLPNHAPDGFNQVRADVPKGKVEAITYDSKSVGVQRKAVVYTPPGYDATKKYPVMYLMHGIGGN